MHPTGVNQLARRTDGAGNKAPLVMRPRLELSDHVQEHALVVMGEIGEQEKIDIVVFVS